MGGMNLWVLAVTCQAWKPEGLSERPHEDPVEAEKELMPDFPKLIYKRQNISHMIMLYIYIYCIYLHICVYVHVSYSYMSRYMSTSTSMYLYIYIYM